LLPCLTSPPASCSCCISPLSALHLLPAMSADVYWHSHVLLINNASLIVLLLVLISDHLSAYGIVHLSVPGFGSPSAASESLRLFPTDGNDIYMLCIFVFFHMFPDSSDFTTWQSDTLSLSSCYVLHGSIPDALLHGPSSGLGSLMQYSAWRLPLPFSPYSMRSVTAPCSSSRAGLAHVWTFVVPVISSTVVTRTVPCLASHLLPFPGTPGQ